MACPTAKDIRTPDVISLISLTGVLALTGVCVFIWMALKGMSDKIGISVAVLFLLLGVSQVLFAVLWWRSKQRNDSYIVNEIGSTKDVEMQESSLMEKPKASGKQE